MKKIMVILTFILALTYLNSNNIKAQNSEKDFKYTVKVNPLAAAGGPFWVVVVPITGEYKVQFEVATGEKQSFQIGASYLGPSIVLNLDEISQGDSEISGINIIGYRVTGAYKFFLSSDLSAPEGLYVGPYISFASAKIENKDNVEDNVTATKLNINGIIGYQLITSGGFTLDIFTGLGYRKINWDFLGENDSVFDLGNNKGGIGLALGLSFGIAF